MGHVRSLICALALAACTGKYVRPTTPDRVPSSAQTIGRGNYLVNQVTMCGVCHTPRVGGDWLGGERADKFLAGGGVFDDRENGYKIATSNITQDKETGIGAWTDDEIARSIRDGVRKNGQLMYPPMPFPSFGVMSDDDVRAIVAYLRTVAPVRNKVDREAHLDLPFMVKVVHGMGVMHHEPAKNVKAPPATDKRAHGAYLAKLGGCWECHSLTKRGPSDDFLMAGSKLAMSEPEYGKVWARNLTPDADTGLGKFTADQIKEALKTGRRLDGKPMAPPMSLFIPHVSTWNEEDLDALVTYLKVVPAIKHKVPERELTPAAKRLVGE